MSPFLCGLITYTEMGDADLRVVQRIFTAAKEDKPNALLPQNDGCWQGVLYKHINGKLR